jgi:hypothetical protein
MPAELSEWQGYACGRIAASQFTPVSCLAVSADVVHQFSIQVSVARRGNELGIRR